MILPYSFTFTYINPVLTPGSPSQPLRHLDQRSPLCDTKRAFLSSMVSISTSQAFVGLVRFGGSGSVASLPVSADFNAIKVFKVALCITLAMCNHGFVPQDSCSACTDIMQVITKAEWAS
ncbi:hypothetical protein D9758_009451 [Tetrapyrgos nigripes]|uniref:Uncharacterized protein n=1 Tax=Tetrapyrgos nigripes TaxID=182062 RepID=A0A8H5FWR7_9AGAR|nr:hypothetical protein D9758_009451 [Tetrapyrgos nigripes]